MGWKRRLRKSALAIMAVVLASTAAESVEFIHRIDRPLPPEIRERAATFLREVRPADAAAAIQNSKAWWNGSPARETVIIIRVEADCPAAGNCMTVIGRMTELGFKAELTLEVGPTFLIMDVSYGLWGSDSGPPLIFDAGDVGVVAISREQGWVVSACASCTNWKGRAREYRYVPEVTKPAVREPETAKQSFEDFQRALHAYRH